MIDVDVEVKRKVYRFILYLYSNLLHFFFLACAQTFAHLFIYTFYSLVHVLFRTRKGDNKKSLIRIKRKKPAFIIPRSLHDLFGSS